MPINSLLLFGFNVLRDDAAPRRSGPASLHSCVRRRLHDANGRVVPLAGRIGPSLRTSRLYDLVRPLLGGLTRPCDLGRRSRAHVVPHPVRRHDGVLPLRPPPPQNRRLPYHLFVPEVAEASAQLHHVLLSSRPDPHVKVLLPPLLVFPQEWAYSWHPKGYPECS